MSAAPTRDWPNLTRVNTRRLLALITAPALIFTLTASTSAATVEVSFTKLRAAKGKLMVCLTTKAKHFPDCSKDANARHVVITAKEGAHTSFTGLPAGTYAVSVVHDENGNGKMDKAVMVPSEGFGFSRNPAIRMGPPRWEEVRFDLSNGAIRQPVRLRYLL